MPPCSLTHEEAVRLKGQIAMSLCNLQTMHAFWSPSLRRFYARSMTTATAGLRDFARLRDSARGISPIPPDAEYLGLFSHGEATAQDVIEAILAA